MEEILDGLFLSESLVLIDTGAIDLSSEDKIKEVAACLAHKAEIENIDPKSKKVQIVTSAFSITKTNILREGDLVCHVNNLPYPVWFYATIDDVANWSPSTNGGYWLLLINTH